MTHNTYKNFKELTKLYEGTKDLNEITIQYQKTNDPVLLAKVFTEYYMYLYSLSNRSEYIYLSETDKESYIVEEVHNAMLAFDESKKTKVQTLIAVFVKNRLRAEANMAYTDKRKANVLSSSYDEMAEATKEKEQSGGSAKKLKRSGKINQATSLVDGAYDNMIGEIESIESIMTIDELTENEKSYCCLVMRFNSDSLKDSDIASLLGISPSAINQIKKSLQKKLAFMRYKLAY